MRLVLAQPATPFMQWQLEVLLTNLRQFGEFDIVLLFTEHNFLVPAYFRKKFPECEVLVYEERPDRSYIPSVRPWLWYKFLSEDPAREHEQYFYIDADIIFREWIDFATLAVSPKSWVASHCKGYIGYADYLAKKQKSDEICARMAAITGITLDQLKAAPGAGAQWVIDSPTAAYWKRVYEDSNAISAYFKPLQSDIQKWTAEMWAQLYGAVREGIVVTTNPELDFITATDDVSRWEQVKIMHNAGVHGVTSTGMFFKGAWIAQAPWGQKFGNVRRDKATIKYVEAIQKVVH